MNNETIMSIFLARYAGLITVGTRNPFWHTSLLNPAHVTVFSMLVHLDTI